MSTLAHDNGTKVGNGEEEKRRKQNTHAIVFMK